LGLPNLHGSEGADVDGEGHIKVLVAKCHLTKCLFAHVVPQKGMDPENYAVERLKRDILWLGHTKVILKSDNERAILALLRNTLKSLRVEHLESAQEAHPAAYDPSSTGSVEVACKSVGGLVSTMRACLEARLRQRVGVQHCVFEWLVEHAAWTHTIRMRQSDGITAYQRLRGMAFGLRMVGFGESCLYKIPKKKPEANLEGKLGSKWKDGVFLGYSRDSNEYVLWSVEDKTVTVSSANQRPSAGSQRKSPLSTKDHRTPCTALQQRPQGDANPTRS
jgi:hypothetical protein